LIAAVLAGGKSSRIGLDKLFLKIGGRPLISYCLEKLYKSNSIEEIVITTNLEKIKKIYYTEYKIIIDSYNVGPLGGLLTALEKVGDVLLVGGDMPMINPSFIDILIKKYLAKRVHAYVPKWNNGLLEPLLACYSKNAIKTIKKAIANKIFSMNKVISLMKTEWLIIDSLPKDYRVSFFNVNTWEDLNNFISMIQRKGRDNDHY